jgi:hypothetical protein
MLEDSGSSWGGKRKMVVVHGGERGKKMRVKWRVTVVHGGIAHFLVVHGGKGNYP